MKNVIIIPNPNKDVDFKVTEALIKKLLSLGITPHIDKKYGIVKDGVLVYTKAGAADLIIVVGGDGSVIDASELAISLDIPIFGVNLGKVGYLSELEPDNLSALDGLVSGGYKILEKLLLCAEIVSNGKKISAQHLALNDIVISHGDYFGIADFVVENSASDKVKYRADSIIISTPSGSTAYSLSAGGPIVAHNVDAMILTPVCPHSFFNRSIVFPSGEVLTVRNVCEKNLKVSVDGRDFATMKNGDSCVISAASKRVKVLTFSENNMFSTLFRKMRILEDIK